MLKYPNIDPVAIDLGAWDLPIVGSIHPQIHWYGIMYLVAFVSCFWLLKYRSTIKSLSPPVKPEHINDLLFYIALGTVLGGRIGYMLFYNFSTLLDNPLTLFKVWQGGMSFHGGLLGVLLAVWLYGKKLGATFTQMTDFIAPGIPLGLMAGRIGNFINAELWGRVTDLPWGMVFPNAGPLPRHPSMLYEALLEGLVLFIIVWFYSSKPRPRMAVSAVFAICYGLFRIAVEFVRQPDEHIGYLAFGWLTMGMLLSLPLIAIGLIFSYFIIKSEKPAA